MLARNGAFEAQKYANYFIKLFLIFRQKCLNLNNEHFAQAHVRMRIIARLTRERVEELYSRNAAMGQFCTLKSLTCLNLDTKPIKKSMF